MGNIKPMKYYDPTTGKVTNTAPGTATTQTPTGSPPAGNYSTSGLPTGGSSGVDLQQLLGLYALAKGNPTGAWSILAPEKETAESKNRKAILQPAKIAIQKAMADKYTMTGPLAWPEMQSIKYLGGLGARQSLIKQNQNFNLLKQNVVRALQGARMSYQDIKLASEYIPSIADTPETIQTKLKGLNEFVDALTLSGSATGQ
jgi:hypothetical protein